MGLGVNRDYITTHKRTMEAITRMGYDMWICPVCSRKQFMGQKACPRCKEKLTDKCEIEHVKKS